MDNDQVATDTAALQSYIDRVKALSKEMDTAATRNKILDSALKDSSQVAKDVARNTNNLDDVMKVYTASTRTATSVAKAFGTTLLGLVLPYLQALQLPHSVKHFSGQTRSCFIRMSMLAIRPQR